MIKLVQRGGIAEVGPIPFAVYMVLRSFVWRSRDKGSWALREEYQKGNLAAVVRRDKVARCAGVGIKTAQRSFAKLEEVGWIKIIHDPGQVNLFILGRKEGKLEVFFADDPGPEGPGVGTQMPRGGRDFEDPGPGSESPGTRVTNDPRYLNSKQEKVKLRSETGKARRIRKTKDRSRSSYLRSESEGPKGILGTPQPPDRAGWTEPGDEPPNGKAALVEDPRIEGRLLTPVEARQLQSARAKTEESREREYSSAEVVAVWRAFFYRAFGDEDPDLATEAQRKRAAQSITQRANDWAGGEKATIRRYLGDMIRLWRDRPEGARFPTGAAPRLSSLLKKDQRGPSTFWRDWDLGRRKRRRDG